MTTDTHEVRKYCPRWEMARVGSLLEELEHEEDDHLISVS